MTDRWKTLRNNAQRALEQGEIEPDEVERLVEVSGQLWVGWKGSITATKEAIELIKKGSA